MNQCTICGREMAKIFSLGNQPLANKYPASKDFFQKEIIEEMTVFYCDPCGYINVPCSIDRSVFFEDYYYLSSINRELVDHFQTLADEINKRNYKFVLDVGSNDGILLKPLKERGIRCIGIDPSENVSEIANAAGLETLVGFFDASSIKSIKSKYGHPDLVCASSVFTHLESPKDFFYTANDLLSDKGEILIEVEYLGDIIESLGFERFYFDRPHYYSVKSLKSLGEQAGFDLIRVERISPHGGSVRAIFARCGSSPEIDDSVHVFIGNEARLLNRLAINEQFGLFSEECKILREKLEEFKKAGINVGAYGCPARFSTITNFANIGPDLLPHVVDDSPLKSGRFSPGKHVPIVPFSPSRRAEVYIVFAYEYIKSIREKVGDERAEYFKPIPFQLI